MTILDAVNQAGGVAQNADTQHIKWTHNGVDRTISLQDIMQYDNMSQNHLLSNGDIVYVPNNSNSKVYIMGEVGRQANLPIGNHDLNLTQALGEAGGMNQTQADATGVFVIRRAPEDAVKPIHIYQLNLKDATAYALGNDFDLRPNDIVYVTAAPVTRWNRVVSQITSVAAVLGRFGGQPIVIHSQSHVVPLYREFGFEPVGPEYPETGIPAKIGRASCRERV